MAVGGQAPLKGPGKVSLPADPALSEYHSASFAIRVQLLALMAMIPLISFPMWWGALVRERGYDLVSFGILQTLQNAGAMVAGIGLIFLIPKLHRGWAAAVSLMILAGTYLSIIYVHEIVSIAVIFGIKGAALTVATAMSTLYFAYTMNPDRQYSIGVTATTIFQSLSFLAIPYIVDWVGNNGLQIVNAICFILAAMIAATLPGKMPDIAAHAAVVEGKASKVPEIAGVSAWWAGVPIIAATILFAVFTVDLFAYTERIGAERGIDLKTIGWIMSVTMAAGVLGSLFGSVFGNRFGRLLPVMFGAALGTIGLAFFLAPTTGMIGYAVGLALFSIVWSLVQPYLSAQIMAIDYSGHIFIASGPLKYAFAFVMTGTITGLLALFGINAVILVALVALLLIPVLVWLSIRLMQPEAVDTLKRMLPLFARSRRGQKDAAPSPD